MYSDLIVADTPSDYMRFAILFYLGRLVLFFFTSYRLKLKVLKYCDTLTKLSLMHGFQYLFYSSWNAC